MCAGVQFVQWDGAVYSCTVTRHSQSVNQTLTVMFLLPQTVNCSDTITPSQNACQSIVKCLIVTYSDISKKSHIHLFVLVKSYLLKAPTNILTIVRTKVT